MLSKKKRYYYYVNKENFKDITNIFYHADKLGENNFSYVAINRTLKKKSAKFFSSVMYLDKYV